MDKKSPQTEKIAKWFSSCLRGLFIICVCGIPKSGLPATLMAAFTAPDYFIFVMGSIAAPRIPGSSNSASLKTTGCMPS